LEGALKEVDENIKSLKQEQASLTGKFAEKPEGDELKNLNARRNDIRAELGSLKERRTMLLAQKRKQEGID
jgi:predicted nuclease with TOPRIM domain